MSRVPVFSGKKCVKLPVRACGSHIVHLLDPSTLGFVPIVEMGIVCLDCL